MSDPSSEKKLSKVKIIFRTIEWVLFWPMIMFIVGIACFAAAFQLTGGQKIGLSMGVFFSLMVLACLVILCFITRRSIEENVVKVNVLRAYTALGVFASLILFGIAFDETMQHQSTDGNTQVASTVTVPTLSRDQKVDQSLMSIGVSQTEIARFSTKEVDSFSSTVLQDQDGLYSSYTNPIDGKFLYADMEIKTNLNSNQFLTVVAHEYMHHVWYAVLDTDTKRKLESDLISRYGLDPGLRTRTEAYIDSKSLNGSELFSYYCTESSDRFLTQYILEQCNKYINRSMLTLQR